MILTEKQAEAIQGIIETLIECPSLGQVFDEGCDGEGDVAKLLVAFGHYSDTEEATNAIFGDDE